jgi:Protein of unknown function (DUF4019)
MESIRKRLAVALFCAVPLFTSACTSFVKDTNLAEAAVSQFHSQLDAAQYAALYAAADTGLHNATSQADFTKLLDAVHRKLGTVRQANLRSWHTGYYVGQGATVTLVYDTTFSAGSGTEQFVWHIDGDRAMLYGYHINSNDLLER